MVVNLLNLLSLSSPINNSYNGSFSVCDFVGGNNEGSKTKSSDFLLEMEKRTMEDRKHIEEVKALLNSKLGDIDRLAKAVGIPTEVVFNLFVDVAGKQAASTSDCKIGDNVQGDKIVFESGGRINKYYDKSTKDKIKVLEIEISECHKRIKDKDETIVSLRETIEILKNK